MHPSPTSSHYQTTLRGIRCPGAQPTLTQTTTPREHNPTTTNLMPTSIRCVSINAKGLNSHNKKHNILRWERKQNIDILLIQETHFTTHCTFPLTNRYYTQNVNVPSPDTKTKVYAPTTPDASFWQQLATHLNTFSTTCLIVGGDCNAIHTPTIDRTPLNPARIPPSQNDTLFSQFLASQNLIDIWRAQHPSTTDFTFYSHPHGSYSRIDHFLISPNLVPQITNSDIGPISWSEHAKIAITITLPTIHKHWTWRLNPLLLHDKLIRHKIAKAIKEYFEMNSPTAITPMSLWAAHKAVIRDTIISLATYKKNKSKQQINKAMAKLRHLGTDHKKHSTSTTLTELK
ncbi:Hypothetical predicted protein [Pelobates cultripes]|uniref:exodeoxyribonuclease III n=1 Tax=Pelobates cultripes TaxID=61616 RepID=A0AAD1VYP0_PELCU|nr:Hypothetical predicted protein [Pelobates cultripes]